MAERKNSNAKKNTKKAKLSSSKHKEDFNTGSHSPSSVRKVGADYDDTGLGNNSKKSSSTNKNVADRKKNTKGK
jgi:hypothetical protein